MSGIVRLALDRLFQSEDVDPNKGMAMRMAIDSKLAVPTGWDYTQLVANLFMLSIHYPEKSAKTYWGPIVYRSSIDKSHKQLRIEIEEEVDRIYKATQNGTAKK